MVSEVIMYQSMFILGILMFGFFAVTFADYGDLADETTLLSNLQQVVDEIGGEIVDLVSRGRSLMTGSAGDSLRVTIDLQLESSFSDTAYSISVGNHSNGFAYVYAMANKKIIANYTLGIIEGTGIGEINFSGNIISDSGNSQIIYTWNALTNIEQIIFV